MANPTMTTTPAPCWPPTPALAALPDEARLGRLLGWLHRGSPRLAAAAALAAHGRAAHRRAAAGADGWRLRRWPFEGEDVVTWHRQDAATGAAAVLFVHDWSRDAQDGLRLAAALAEAGVEPLLVDMPAHGRSSGARSSVATWSRALQAIGGRLAPLHGGVGHGLGALALAHAAARGLVVPRLVLAAPRLPAAADLGAWLRAQGLPAAFAGAVQRLCDRREGAALREFAPAALGRALPMPTRVLHDRADPVAPFAGGLALAQALPRGRMQAVDAGGCHALLAEADGIAPTLAALAGPALQAGT